MRTAGYFKTVAGAAVLIIAVNSIGKLTGFLREIVFAASFGVRQSFDIYLVSAAIPVTLTTAIFYIAQNFLVPQFHSAGGTEKAKARLSVYVIVFTTAALFLSVLLFLFSDPVIGIYLHGTSRDELQLVIRVYKLFILTLPFVTIASVLTAYLYSEFRFFASSLLLIVPNIFIIAAVMLFESRIGIYSIPIGSLIGYVLQMFLLLLIVRPPVFRGEVLRETLSGAKGSLIVYVIIIEVIGQLYILADRYFYTMIPAGGIAAINYAGNLYALPLQMIPLAISTVVFTRISKDYHSGNTENIQSNLFESSSAVLYLFIPLMVIYFFDGDFLLKVLYQRGKFDDAAVRQTFEMVRIFGLGLAISAVYSILNKVMYSVQAVREIFSMTLIALLIKIILNFLLAPVFQTGGLVMATIISYLFLLIYSAYTLHRKSIIAGSRAYFREIMVSGINAIVSYAIVKFGFTAILNSDGYALLRIILFLAVYGVNGWIIRQNSLRVIILKMPFLSTERINGMFR